MNKRNEIYPTMARTFPVWFFYFTILNCILSPSYNSFYIFIMYCSVVGSNWIIKYLVMKPIYDLLKTNYLPILGIGSRPPKATGCHFILDNIPANSYGMPSGHSQIAWTFATYIILKIIKKQYNNVKTNSIITTFDYMWLILSCILTLCIAIYISYSRVYIEGCHTIQQVIIGGFFGVISGFLIYYFENDTIHLFSKYIY